MLLTQTTCHYTSEKAISRDYCGIFLYGEHFCCFCLNMPCISWVFQLSSERICQLLKGERQISWIALPYQHSRWSASSTCNVLYILWRVDTHHISRRRCHTAQTRSYLPKLSFFFKWILVKHFDISNSSTTCCCIVFLIFNGTLRFARCSMVSGLGADQWEEEARLTTKNGRWWNCLVTETMVVV